MRNLREHEDAGTTDDKTALTGQQILDEGLDGWRKVLDKLVVRFETGDFNTGAALVTKIAEAADEANHHPDVDLRYPHLTVSLMSHDVERDHPARRPAGPADQRARRRGRRQRRRPRRPTSSSSPWTPRTTSRSSPSGRRCSATRRTRTDDDLSDGADRTPSVWFQETDSEAPDRQRWHLDVSVPHDVAAGSGSRRRSTPAARWSTTSAAPAFWVLADADGNRACICTWRVAGELTRRLTATCQNVGLPSHDSGRLAD